MFCYQIKSDLKRGKCRRMTWPFLFVQLARVITGDSNRQNKTNIDTTWSSVNTNANTNTHANTNTNTYNSLINGDSKDMDLSAVEKRKLHKYGSDHFTLGHVNNLYDWLMRSITRIHRTGLLGFSSKL